MLKCHNDGKEKSQSFEVYDDDYNLNQVQTGYGPTMKEALDEYKNNVNEYIESLNKYNDTLKTKTAADCQFVDCLGKPI